MLVTCFHTQDAVISEASVNIQCVRGYRVPFFCISCTPGVMFLFQSQLIQKLADMSGVGS